MSDSQYVALRAVLTKLDTLGLGPLSASVRAAAQHALSPTRSEDRDSFVSYVARTLRKSGNAEAAELADQLK